MSALEELIARFQRDLYKPEREHLRRAELEAMQFHNAIAHELAEKIRQSAPCYGGVHHYDDGECHRTFEAADLIDPESS